MAQNHIVEGDVIPVVLGATIASGAGILVGSIVGVSLAAGVSGDTVQVAVEGVFAVKKKTTDVVAQGAILYWDNTNKELTTTSTSNTKAGYAYSAAGNGATTVEILLRN